MGFEAQQRAWLDAAALVDDKWDEAERQAGRVRSGFARLLGDAPSNIALGQNTHELVTRWLSALPLRQRPRLVTTDGEFHSLRRQTDRLAEDSPLEIVKVRARPAATLGERLAAAVSDRTAAVMVSSVLYETAEIVPGLEGVAAACRRAGAELLVDAYHHLNVVPFELQSMGLADAFVTGGGYKHCQLGEGNCFLRVPPDRRMRPVLTGWFAEFAALPEEHTRGVVAYGHGAAAFGGATYDPTSHYRAAAVFAFHEQQGLTPDRLRTISRHQMGLLTSGFEALGLDAGVARIDSLGDARAGFLAIRAPRAGEISAALRQRGVFTDARGQILRMGPAPYLSDTQITDSMTAFGEVARAMPRRP